MLLLSFVGAALAQDLSLDVGPMASAGAVDLQVNACLNGSTVYFLGTARGPGNGPCPAQLGGACIDLLQPKVMGSRTCNNTQASMSPVPPVMAPGADLSFQAIASNGQMVQKSDVVTRYADQWWHQIAVDGTVTNEWLAGAEDFGTTSGLGTTWVSWDANMLYVAAQHPDITAVGGLHWLVIYVGNGVAGTTTGATFNTQSPMLVEPFSHLIRWKADDSYNSRMMFDGVGWVSDDYWLGTDGSSYAELEIEETIEIAIPWNKVGVTDQAVVHVAWLYEGSGFESTYAGVPARAFTDGYDPDVNAVLYVDLTNAASPVLQNP